MSDSKEVKPAAAVAVEPVEPEPAQAAVAPSVTPPAQSQEASNGIWGLWSTIKSKATQLEGEANTYLESPSKLFNNKTLSELTEKAGKIIDTADARLGNMESTAGSFITQLASDLKQVVAIEDCENLREETVFVSPTLFSGTRVEAQLNALHGDPSKILEAEPLVSDLSHRQDDIETAKTDKQVLTLLDQLVPSELTEEEFWMRYLGLRDQIIASDKRRRDLLKRQAENEEKANSPAPVPEPKKTQATPAATKASPKEAGTAETKTPLEKEEVDEESDFDDWE